MGREAPGGHRGEHVVLEHEIPGICPIVRDIPSVMVAHDVRTAFAPADRIPVVDTTAGFRRYPDPEVAVHLAAVDVVDQVLPHVRPAGVVVVSVVIGTLALARPRVWNADGGDAVLHGDAVGTGEGAEVAVEGSVLLHDDDDVLDLVDTVLRSIGGSR